MLSCQKLGLYPIRFRVNEIKRGRIGRRGITWWESQTDILFVSKALPKNKVSNFRVRTADERKPDYNNITNMFPPKSDTC